MFHLTPHINQDYINVEIKKRHNIFLTNLGLSTQLSTILRGYLVYKNAKVILRRWNQSTRHGGKISHRNVCHDTSSEPYNVLIASKVSYRRSTKQQKPQLPYHVPFSNQFWVVWNVELMHKCVPKHSSIGTASMKWDKK